MKRLISFPPIKLPHTATLELTHTCTYYITFLSIYTPIIHHFIKYRNYHQNHHIQFCVPASNCKLQVYIEVKWISAHL